MSFLKSVKNKSFPIDFPGHWINNEWTTPKSDDFVKKSLNPNDESLLMTVTLSKETMVESIDRSYEFLSIEKRLDNPGRVEILRQIKSHLGDSREDIVSALAFELGRPVAESEIDFQASMKYLQWTIENEQELFDAISAPARIGSGNGQIGLQPIGVTLGFLPFSTPLFSFIHYVTSCVVARSPLTLVVSGNAAITGLLLTKVIEKVNLPKGMINVVFGNFSAFTHVLSDKRIKAILYTGSTEHCDIIRRESRSHLGRQLILQSGGKNSVLVHSSADIAKAVRIVAMGIIKGVGQLCTSTSQVFVYSNIVDEFNQQLESYLQALVIGRTDTDESSHVGPLYSEKAVEKFLRYQTMAGRETQKTLIWGESINRDSKGFFVQPGVHYMKEFDPKSSFQSNILFGPHMSVYSYEELETAISQINHTSSPFVVSFVGDEEILKSRRYKFVAPNLMHNLPTVEMESPMPVAGRLSSGDYRYNGPGLSAILSYPQVLQHSENIDLFEGWLP